MNRDPISLPLELLTPAWATGADQQQAEIRVPTLRGQLRFWLRMLFPGQDLDKAILGTADSHDVVASRVSLRLKSVQASSKVQNLDEYTGKAGDTALQDPEAYFLWPLRPTGQSQQKRGVLHPPAPGQNASFVLEILWLPPAYPLRARLEPALRQALDAFSLLGAFGSRSTRGYGSVWPQGWDVPDAAALRNKLSFLPNTISIRLLPYAASSGRQALATSAKWFRSLRIGTGRFGENPSRWGRNDHDIAPGPSRSEVLYRPALGLPLAQNYRNGPRLQTKYQWHDPDTGRETWNDRYPSPVRFKVARLGGQYRVLLVILRDQLLAETTRLRVEECGRPVGEARMSHDLVNEMAKAGEAVH